MTKKREKRRTKKKRKHDKLDDTDKKTVRKDHNLRKKKHDNFYDEKNSWKNTKKKERTLCVMNFMMKKIEHFIKGDNKRKHEKRGMLEDNEKEQTVQKRGQEKRK